MSIKIVTDSTACLTREFCDAHQIGMVSLAYTFEGEYMEEGYCDDWDQFYRRFAASTDFPRTSQAQMHGFIKEFERAAAEGFDAVICLTITSKVSGTFSAASTAAKMVAPGKIFVVDSKGGAVSLKMMVLDTLKRIEEGKSVEELYALACWDADHTLFQFTAETLEYLRRSGRISSAMALLGGLMKILPLIHLVDGAMTVVDRVRGGEMKVIDKMIKNLPDKLRKVGVCHVLAQELAQSVAERVRSLAPGVEILVEQVDPVIGCHLGPGAVGIAAVYE